MNGDSAPRRRRNLVDTGSRPNASAVSLLTAAQPDLRLSTTPGGPGPSHADGGQQRNRPFDADDLLPIVDSPVSSMPGKERTQEFIAFAKSLQMKMTPSAVDAISTRHAPEANRFSQMAKQVGQNLTQTFVKLEKLTMLAKRRTLFDEHVGEMDELTQIIKQDIGALNNQIASLQKQVQSNYGGAQSSSNQTQHSKTVVVNFQSRLATMSTDFKQLLEIRTENLKHQRLRRQQFSTAQPVPSSMPASASKGSLLLSNDGYDSQNGQYVVDMAMLDGEQQLQIYDQQDSYIQSRAETMANIETTIVELGQIFAQLGRMVQEQGDMVQRIDSNVDETALHVDSAHMELVKYFRSISRNRWLAFKVFAVLIAMFIFFVLFML